MIRRLRGLVYGACLFGLGPLNRMLARRHTRRFVAGSVLHVSYAGHVPAQTVQILRANGVNAAYLAVGGGDAPGADYQMPLSRWPWQAAWREFRMLWTVVSHYEIVHAHFMATMTRSGWEWPILKRMGRKIVVQYRGCEIRDRRLNMASHPDVNICQECDYRPLACEAPHNVLRRGLASRFGDAFLVTTPDLKEFAPSAIHIPFFAPIAAAAAIAPRSADRELKIVHATNHPGIEGTRHIQRAIDSLRAKGHRVRLVVLTGVPHDEVLAELGDADLAIGKMKMGYYANAQIESMAMGVPAVTYVRPEFMTAEVRESGLILSTLATLEETLAYYLTHPEALEAKRAAARASILRVHDNRAISDRYRAVYAGLR
jgi:hypothetical protein